jgi:hypothetical protein
VSGSGGRGSLRTGRRLWSAAVIASCSTSRAADFDLGL